MPVVRISNNLPWRLSGTAKSSPPTKAVVAKARNCPGRSDRKCVTVQTVVDQLRFVTGEVRAFVNLPKTRLDIEVRQRLIELVSVVREIRNQSFVEELL